MSISLAYWLRAFQEEIYSRWLPALASTHASTHDPLLDSRVDTYNQELEQASVLQDVFASLLASSESNTMVLNRYLYDLSTTDETEWPLHNLIESMFGLRRVVRELLREQDLPLVEVLALIDDLDALVEHIVAELTHARVSQAHFLTMSLAQATEESDRAALQLSALNEVSRQLSTSLDVDHLLDVVYEKLDALLGVEHISIWLRDEAGRLRAAQCQDNTTLVGMTLDWCDERDLVWRAYTTGEQVYDALPTPGSQGAWHQPHHGVSVIPLMVQDQTTGVIVLQDEEPEQQLARPQQNLARAIANQAAIALENARLYEQIQRFNSELEQLVAARTGELQAERDRLTTLHDIALEVSSTLDLDSLLHNSLQALARITNAKHGSIMLTEPDTGHLVSRAVLGEQVDVGYTRFPPGTGIAGWVAQQKRPALVPDVSLDERWITLPSGAASRSRQGAMIAVPLIAQNEMVGVLTLSHPQTHAFNQDHLRLLAASAGEIAVGIHNANLYHDIVGEMEHNAELVRRLRRESGQNVAILQSLSDGVLVCDLDGAVLSVNPAAERIVQSDTQTLLIENMHNLIDTLAEHRAHELPLTSLLKHPLDAKQQPRIFQSTFEIGSRTVSATLGPVLTENQELIGALVLLHDITREVEADRLKTEFIGTMSHELRTPMTSIKGFTQLLAMGSLGEVNEVQKESINTIAFNAERMISIINDVLDITKIEARKLDIHLHPLPLGDSVISVVSELQNVVQGRGHTVTINMPPDLPLVIADAKRLQQILYNLIHNAIKYTTRNGRVDVSAHEVVVEQLPNHARERLAPGKRYVRVDVHDTGVGISPEDQTRIFERFYRTNNPLRIEAGGTGLGLSLVRPLIELLGGRIWLVSAIDQGTTFSFVLPAA